RWSSVGLVSMGISVSVPVKWIWLLVRVARCVSRPRKRRSGLPAASWPVEALASAPVERCAGAMGLSRVGGCSSVNVIGAQALRRCHEVAGQHADQHVGADAVVETVVDGAQVQVVDLDDAEVAF